MLGFHFSGVEAGQVQERVENHLKSLLIKHFDPQKADSIFTVEGEVRPGVHLLWGPLGSLHSPTVDPVFPLDPHRVLLHLHLPLGGV